MVLAPGPGERSSYSTLFPFLGGGGAEPFLDPQAMGYGLVAFPGSPLAAGSEHELGSVQELTTRSPRENLGKSHHPLPAAWPSSSGFL